MRTVACLAVMLLAVALGSGCDSDKPLQIEEQTLELTVSAPGAFVPTFNVWDLFEDSNDDSVPDGDVNLWCELLPFPQEAASVPWDFAIQVRVLRVGQTRRCSTNTTILCNNNADCPFSETCLGGGDEFVPVNITSPAALDAGTSLVPGTNMAPYDTLQLPGNFNTQPSGRANPEVVVDDEGNTHKFRFRRPRRLTIANREVIESDTNFLHEIDPSTYGGVCPGRDLGPPRIDGDPQPFAIELNKGDTVFVEVRRFDTPPPGLDAAVPPALSARVLVDGRFVNVLGSTSSTNESGAGFSFSYTSR